MHPYWVAFLPALMLGAYWFGGQGVLVILGLTMPLLLLLLGMAGPERPGDALTGLAGRSALVARLDEDLSQGDGTGIITIVLRLDGMAGLARDFGPGAVDAVLRRSAERLSRAVRSGDLVARLDEASFGLRLVVPRAGGLNTGLAAAERLMATLSEPVSLDARTVHLTVTGGLCLGHRAPRRTGAALLEAAETARDIAARSGMGAVRAYSAGMLGGPRAVPALARDLAAGLADGQVRPWFQPQVDLVTGAVSGFEALARWDHPERGQVPPAEFLPVARSAGLMEDLGEVILASALSTLRDLDRAGCDVPRMAVNLCAAELANPRLVDRIRWELDRFEMPPARLALEIDETVLAGVKDETAAANLAELAAMGCLIDLEDFGSGQASIANIRRFAVSRLKIDPQLISRIDQDPGQRDLVAAILSMARELGVATLAKGVETAGEYGTLGRLGCGHMQGHVVAPAMPAERLAGWIEARRRRLPSVDPSRRLLA